MPVKSADKAELKRIGAWNKFLLRRDELKKSMSPREANDRAVMDCLGENNEDGPSEIKHPMRLPVNPEPEELQKEPFETEAEKSVQELINNLPSRSKPTDLIQWVAANLKGDINFEDCPGRDAFALLLDCQSVPSFRLDFWKTMYTKVIPSRAQLGDDDAIDEIDGAMTLAVLDKIAKISEAVQKKADKDETCEDS